MKVVGVVLLALISINTFALDQDKIIGENDLLMVNAAGSNVPLKFKKLLNAFGLMSLGCTATHIGNGYVLTAGHCLYAPEVLTRNLDCAEITIEWGVREGVSPYLKSTCEKVIATQKSKLTDFAILKVSPVPDSSVEVELVRKAVAGDTLTIFSHPEELPLQWSKTCVVATELDPKLPLNALQHQCDTNSGSSGATILDGQTGKVVGIHDGGRLSSPTMGMNYGTYITNPEIVETLKEIGF